MTDTRNKLTSVTLTVMLVLSVFAGAFAGTAAAADESNYEFDEKLEDGNTYWQGQTLYKNETTDNSSETYELHGDDDANSDYFQQVRTDSEGVLLINTDEMSTGSYYLEDNTNTKVATFTVASQSFSVDSSDADSSDSTYTFEFASNRVGFDVHVATEGGLNASDLNRVFSNGGLQNIDDDSNDEFVIQNVNDGDAYDATFNEEDAGEYNFTFTVVDTGVSDKLNNFNVAKQDEATASFESTSVTDQEGDIAEFNVSLDGTDRAVVQVGDEEIGYQYNFTVVDGANTDGDGDGVVTVQFNTLNAGDGTDNTVSAAADEDAIQHTDHDAETTIASDALEPGLYDLSVRVNDEEKDLAALGIQERNTEGVSTLLVPDDDKTNTISDISENGVSGSTVAVDDKVVFKFAASGMEAQLAGVSASDLDAGTAGMQVTATEESPALNRQADELDVSQASLRTDAENDTFYLIFDTANFDLEDGDEYKVTFNMTEANPYIDNKTEAEEQSASASFTVTERTLELDDFDKQEDTVFVTPESNYSLSGTTTAAPGTELTIVTRADGAAAYLDDEEVLVNEDGTFSAEFDFSRLSDGDEFSIEVKNFQKYDAEATDGQPEKYALETNVVTQDGEAVDNATIRVDGVAYEGDINLSDGTYTVTASADGYADASQEVTVDGSEQAVTLTLGAAQHDLNIVTVDENGEAVDATVTVDGEAVEGETIALEDGTYEVSASADGFEDASQDVTVDGAAQSVTITMVSDNPTTTTPPATTTPDNTTTSGSTGGDDGESGGSVPGFGVGIALVAVLGAALLVLRE